MSGNLLDQADALMRRRSFVAGTKTGYAGSGEPIATVADAALEDVPLLTDVVDDDDVLQHAHPQEVDAGSRESEDSLALRIEQAVRQRLNQVLANRQNVLAQEIEAWLDEQMPQLVIRAMDGITDHLVALLANRAKDDLLPRLEAALMPPDEAESGVDSAV